MTLTLTLALALALALTLTLTPLSIYLSKAMELKEMRLGLEHVSRGAVHVSVTWCPLSS